MISENSDTFSISSLILFRHNTLCHFWRAIYHPNNCGCVPAFHLHSFLPPILWPDQSPFTFYKCRAADVTVFRARKMHLRIICRALDFICFILQSSSWLMRVAFAPRIITIYIVRVKLHPRIHSFLSLPNALYSNTLSVWWTMMMAERQARCAGLGGLWCRTAECKPLISSLVPLKDLLSSKQFLGMCTWNR